MSKAKPDAGRAKSAVKKAGARSKLLKRMVRDVDVAPTVKEIERSFERSKTETLKAFRSKIGW